jgi:hypothetical protein
MKLLLLAALAALVFTGCATDNADYRLSKDGIGDNMYDVGRQGSPSAPFTRGNGSQNF